MVHLKAVDDKASKKKTTDQCVPYIDEEHINIISGSLPDAVFFIHPGWKQMILQCFLQEHVCAKWTLPGSYKSVSAI